MLDAFPNHAAPGREEGVASARGFFHVAAARSNALRAPGRIPPMHPSVRLAGMDEDISGRSPASRRV